MPSTATNGHNGHSEAPTSRADEVSDLLDAVRKLVVPFVQAADEDDVSSLASITAASSKNPTIPVLLDHKSPHELQEILGLQLSEDPQGRDGLLDMIGTILKYSVNTWSQGFLDKLYASPSAVGVVAELLLAVLNTNVHVYQVSPVLTLIEKYVTAELARIFGYTSLHAGGVSQPGGSASNGMSITIARNTLFPETKTDGLGGRRWVLFTSQHGHYSLEKAAQIQGFGSKAVRPVPVDDQGRMVPEELEKLVAASKAAGETPFYVNATAGTTVMGSYDPIPAIADICERHKLWLHVDACWGGAVAFSPSLRQGRLDGVERADSIAFNPHKMLGVPVTCSFLLGKDMRQFWKAMTLPAGYLFHTDASAEPNPAEMYDLADLTPQCGRRADSLKLYLTWLYYGTSGLRSSVDRAFATASHMFSLIEASSNFVTVSRKPLPCTQVCFYYAPGGQLSEQDEQNGEQTSKLVGRLLQKGFMVDYAPGPRGKMVRAVVNIGTKKETVETLVKLIEQIGSQS